MCKWRLWLYFHRASKEGITGLLPKKERDRESNECSNEKMQSLQYWPFSPKSAKDTLLYIIIQHITVHSVEK